MSEEHPNDQPWFVELLTTGTSAVPGTTARVTSRHVERGAIDVPSGRLRIGVFQVWSTTPPLDDDVVPGEWLVTAVEDEHFFASVGDLLLFLRAASAGPAVAYRRATRNGQPARTDGRNVIIGDSDVGAVLSEEAAGSRLWWLGGPVKTDNAAVEEGQQAGLLTSGSRCRAYYLGDRGWETEAQHSQRTHRPGRAEVWAGLDADGRVCEIVVDFTAIVRAQPFEMAEDPWAAPVVGGPGLLVESPDAVPESAAVHLLIDEAPPGRLLFLGHVALEGRLCAYDPACPDWGTDLPVEG